MKNLLLAVMVAIAAMGLFSCSKKTTSVVSSAAYATPETTVQLSQGDGSVTLRVWGKGTTVADAVENAKKQAVYDVIFTTLRGAGGTQASALVNEVNARERYADYFDPFFADGGEYLNFVTEELGNQSSRLEAKGASIYNYGILATVNRPALRRQLVNDGVLKQ